MSAPVLQLMSRKGCCLCDDAEKVIAEFVTQGRCQLEVQDVDEDIALAARYGMDVPVLLHAGKVLLMHRIEMKNMQQLLSEDMPC